jgi:hypothetical protein
MHHHFFYLDAIGLNTLYLMNIRKLSSELVSDAIIFINFPLELLAVP